jgi:hypothetical protein
VLEESDELEELEAPVEARPAVEAPPAADAPDPEDPDPEDPDPDELLLEALVVPLADTTSPTWPESETIVPVSGA